MNHSIIIHPDLLVAQKLAYEPNGLIWKNLRAEAESKEYAACMFEINNKQIIFRKGKITPTKIGQFVTLWKRIGSGPIQPFDVEDPVDLFIVSVRNADHFGQFIFPKAILCEQGILSSQGKGGKRAMRIYPSWDIALNSQAKRTQAWQLKYFFEMRSDMPIDAERLRKLLV